MLWHRLTHYLLLIHFTFLQDTSKPSQIVICSTSASVHILLISSLWFLNSSSCIAVNNLRDYESLRLYQSWKYIHLPVAIYMYIFEYWLRLLQLINIKPCLYSCDQLTNPFNKHACKYRLLIIKIQFTAFFIKLTGSLSSLYF